MQTISQGFKGAPAMFVQRMLNKAGATPALGEDADFGRLTKAAVVAFQSANGIHPANGTVSHSTWSRFGRIIEHKHRVNFSSQPTNMTCWSAAATMMVGGGQSMGPGSSTMHADGGLEPSLANIEVFARDMGWRMLTNMSAPPPGQLITGLQRGPIWVVFQGATFAHAVVFNEVFSDGDASGDGTVFAVQDPWPPGVGTQYATTYKNHRIILRSNAAKPEAMIAAAAS